VCERRESVARELTELTADELFIEAQIKVWDVARFIVCDVEVAEDHLAMAKGSINKKIQADELKFVQNKLKNAVQDARDSNIVKEGIVADEADFLIKGLEAAIAGKIAAEEAKAAAHGAADAEGAALAEATQAAADASVEEEPLMDAKDIRKEIKRLRAVLEKTNVRISYLQRIRIRRGLERASASSNIVG